MQVCNDFKLDNLCNQEYKNPIRSLETTLVYNRNQGKGAHIKRVWYVAYSGLVPCFYRIFIQDEFGDIWFTLAERFNSKEYIKRYMEVSPYCSYCYEEGDKVLMAKVNFTGRQDLDPSLSVNLQTIKLKTAYGFDKKFRDRRAPACVIGLIYDEQFRYLGLTITDNCFQTSHVIAKEGVVEPFFFEIDVYYNIII